MTRSFGRHRRLSNTDVGMTPAVGSWTESPTQLLRFHERAWRAGRCRRAARAKTSAATARVATQISTEWGK
jgi:hypothetical protein